MKLPDLSKILPVMAAVLLTFGVGVPVAQAEEDPFARAAHFTEPGSKSHEIVDHLLDLIEGAADGSTITIATYKFEGTVGGDVRDALFLAHARGAHIQVIASKGAAGGSTYEKLKEIVNGWDDPKSFVQTCKGGDGGNGNDGNACFGTHKMHNKFYLFSETHGSKNVVVQSTENLEDKRWWNSSYTIRYKPLYDHYSAYFDELKKATETTIRKPDFYDEPGLGHVYIGNYAVYHSPRTRSSGNTVRNILNNVECFGNTSGGTGGKYPHRTIVRVSNWEIKGAVGEAIAEKLWQLDNAGCYVDVVVNAVSQDKKDPTKPLQRLLRKPLPCPEPVGNCHGPEVREFYENAKEGYPLHEKNLMIDGNYDGDGNQKVVFTGSVNFNNKSLENNDETWLRLYDNQAYDDFVTHFQHAKCAAHINWQSTKAPRPWNTAVESNCPAG